MLSIDTCRTRSEPASGDMTPINVTRHIRSLLVVVLERCWSRRVDHPLLGRPMQGRTPLLGRLARPRLVGRPCALATNSGSGWPLCRAGGQRSCRGPTAACAGELCSGRRRHASRGAVRARRCWSVLAAARRASARRAAARRAGALSCMLPSSGPQQQAGSAVPPEGVDSRELAKNRVRHRHVQEELT